ncbi:MAG: hypothetical protein JW943_03070 [Deltaproteobacteria bacterium]|nr:hypothetical protein [Deltaproteobacteria bacterium]
MERPGMYLIGYVLLICGLLAALWKMGVLSSIGTTWSVIAVVIAVGIGIMFAVTSRGGRDDTQIDRK